MRLRPERVAIEGIKSALFTADWQFQRPIGTESNVVEDRGTVRRLLGLACLQRTARALRVLVVIVQI